MLGVDCCCITTIVLTGAMVYGNNNGDTTIMGINFPFKVVQDHLPSGESSETQLMTHNALSLLFKLVVSGIILVLSG